MAKDKAAPAVKVPDGYDDIDSFIKEARERFQEAVDADADNRTQGEEDLKFLAGEQWDAEALKQRSGRPCLTINQMPSFVAQVVGDIRQNRPAVRIRPAEDADKDLADVREGLIRFIERDNDAVGVYIQAGENQVACGIGNFRLGLKYSTALSFDRDIAIEAIPNPFAVVWDPLSVERTGRDARYCFVVDTIPRKTFETKYKTKIDSGLTVPTTDANGWCTTDTVRVTEYWLMKTRKVKIAQLEGGEVVLADEVPEGAVVVREREADKSYACMYLINGQDILEGPYELPIDRVPIIRAQGWVVNVAERRVRFGLIRFAKDPQRLKNYWRSISAETLALAPKGKWLVPERSEGDADTFRNAHNNNDTVLPYSGEKPDWIDPPQLNSAVLQESAANAQDMKDVTGLHDASLGIQSNETSGRAIMARQREGDVASYIYPDNLGASIKECGRIINDLIPIVFDTVRSIRVLGEDESMKVQKINDPNDPESIDINQGRYDVAIDTGPSYTTKRVEAGESMMAFIQAVPGAAPMIGDLVAQSQDWPMADKIAERLKKALPPQFQEQDEDTPPTPEMQAQMQAAQEQQAMAQTMAQLEVAEKQADVAKAQAEALRAKFEAQKAEIDVQRAPVEAFERGVKLENSFGQGEPNPDKSAKGKATAAA